MKIPRTDEKNILAYSCLLISGFLAPEAALPAALLTGSHFVYACILYSFHFVVVLWYLTFYPSAVCFRIDALADSPQVIRF